MPARASTRSRSPLTAPWSTKNSPASWRFRTAQNSPAHARRSTDSTCKIKNGKSSVSSAIFHWPNDSLARREHACSASSCLDELIGLSGRTEIAAQRFERIPLALDFVLGSKSEPAQDGQWRAPSFQGMLKEKTLDNQRDQYPLAVVKDGQSQARERADR